MDKVKQEEIFTEYYKKVLNYIWKKVQNQQQAEDITSVVFLKVFEKYDSFDETKSRLSTWIYTIANNTVIDHYRTLKVAEEIPEDICDNSDVEEEVLSSIDLENLANALKKLKERERDLIILHYYKDMTLKEVALQLGMSYANAKIVHAKALKELGGLLGE